MKIFIDNGHGIDTAGKCSPDGKHREWIWCRRMVSEIKRRLEADGFEAVLVVPEDADISLKERCRRVNALADSTHDILVSIHNNAAASDGRWHSARGFCAFVAPAASENSRRLARLLTTAAVRAGLGGNRALQPHGYLTANFAICRGTRCPAVLTENLFQDNRDDVAFLASDDGFDTIARVHVEAIKEYAGLL